MMHSPTWLWLAFYLQPGSYEFLNPTIGYYTYALRYKYNMLTLYESVGPESEGYPVDS